MGLECGLVQVTPDEISRLRREPAWYPERRPLESYSLGKVWHGLHYLLTGSADSGTGPLDLFAVAIRQLRTGAEGRNTLDPGQVKELHRALESIAPGALQLRWEPDRMASAGVYWADYFQGHPESEYEHQLALFAEVKGFVAEAASKNMGLLVEAG
jgi:hypothetical protein